MKAFIVDHYGSADRVRASEVPDPENAQGADSRRPRQDRRQRRKGGGTRACKHLAPTAELIDRILPDDLLLTVAAA